VNHVNHQIQGIPKRRTYPLVLAWSKVLARWQGTMGILCTVTIAAGDMAFNENKEHGMAAWRNIWELWPE
jgi:hypothetical protein